MGRLRLDWFQHAVCLAGLVCLFGLLPACAPTHLPERNGMAKTWQDVKGSYQDYLRLENAGVEMLDLKMGDTSVTVALPFYLFTIARECERLGKGPEAVKLYLRLLMHYPLLDEDNQLGIRIENRLHWILGDKRWLQPSAGQLAFRLQKALKTKNKKMLERFISRDFGFGEDTEDRVVVNYHWAVEFVDANWQNPSPLSVEVIPRDENTVWLKVSGWSGEHKIWYWVLRQREHPRGWEWDTVIWGD